METKQMKVDELGSTVLCVLALTSLMDTGKKEKNGSINPQDIEETLKLQCEMVADATRDEISILDHKRFATMISKAHLLMLVIGAGANENNVESIARRTKEMVDRLMESEEGKSFNFIQAQEKRH